MTRQYHTKCYIRLVILTVLWLFSSVAYTQEKVNWQAQNKYGKTLLIKIFEGKAWQDKDETTQLETLKLAFKNGEIDPNVRDGSGKTAAHYAIEKLCYNTGYNRKKDKIDYLVRLSLIKMLLKQPSVDPNIRDYHNRATPLMMLLRSMQSIISDCHPRIKAVFESMLTHDDLHLDYRDADDHTMSHLLNGKGGLDKAFAKQLKQLLAQHQVKFEEPFDLSQSYAMWETLQNAVDDPSKHYDFYEKALLKFLANDADPNCEKRHWPPLVLIARTRNRVYGSDIEDNNLMRTKLAALMIEQGANINDFNQRGETPLEFALEGRNVSLVKLLLVQPTLDINVQNSKGDTPIMSYVRYQSSRDHFAEIMALLHQYKSKMDLSITNYEGQTLEDIILKVSTPYKAEVLGQWSDKVPGGWRSMFRGSSADINNN